MDRILPSSGNQMTPDVERQQLSAHATATEGRRPDIGTEGRVSLLLGWVRPCDTYRLVDNRNPAAPAAQDENPEQPWIEAKKYLERNNRRPFPFGNHYFGHRFGDHYSGILDGPMESNIVVIEIHRNGSMMGDPREIKTISELGNYLERRKNLLLLPPNQSSQPVHSPSPVDSVPTPDNFSPSPGSSQSPDDPPPSDDPLELGDSFLFLMEDPAPGLIGLVGSYLSIPPEVFIQHSSGGGTCRHWVAGEPSSSCSCNDQTPLSRLLKLDTKISSISWWSARTYNVRTHNVVTKIQEKSDKNRKVAWKRVAVPPAEASHDDRQQDVYFGLRRGIFRAYQAISELLETTETPEETPETPEGNTATQFKGYICAVEERATSYVSSQNCGS